MKWRSVLLLICFTAIFVSAYSSEPKYSCDPEIEKWARANIDHYATAPRSEIAALSAGRQRAINVGLPAERKELLWREKLADILREPDLSDAEKQEIEKLYNKFIPLFYEGPDAAEAQESEVLKWMDMMKTKFDWTDNQIYYYTFTWLTKAELDAVQPQE